MYPIVCFAGFPIPVKKGTFEICQIKATLKDTTRDARLTLVDDHGIKTNAKHARILASNSTQVTRICDEKTSGNTESFLTVNFFEPIKLRYGLSAQNTTNLLPGSIFVYIR